MKPYFCRKFFLSTYVSMSFLALFLTFYSISFPYKALVLSSPFLIVLFNYNFKYPSSLALFFWLFIFLGTATSFAYLLRCSSLISMFFVCLSFLHSLLIGYILSKERLFNSIASLPFVLFCLWCVWLIFAEVDFNAVFPRSSRNTFSWIALFGASMFYMIQYGNKKDAFKPSILPALFCFFISFFSLGRSGIASSFFLLFGVVFFRFIATQKKIAFLCVSSFYLSLFFCFFCFTNKI